MATHICLVLSNAVEGRDDEYNDWYDNQHLADVLRETGCTSAKRYRLSDMVPAQRSDQRYLAIYEVETDDPAAVLAALTHASGTPAMPMSAAFDFRTLQMLFFEQVTARETAAVPDRSFIDQLSGVWQATGELCRSLQADEWDLPTDCPGWTVRDQLSHIIGTESMLLGRSAPPAAPAGLAHVRNPIGEMNEAWIEARRATPGDALIAEFEEVTGARLAALRQMTDEELEAETPSPIGKVPYATFMDVRIMDCWVHEQDIRRAVGRPGGMDTPAATTALRRFAATLGFVVGKRVGAPDGTTVVFDLSGPQGQVLAVGVRDGRAQPVADVAEPTVRIAMDTETFVCLVGGRRTAADAKVTYAGDEALGRTVVDNLATIP